MFNNSFINKHEFFDLCFKNNNHHKNFKTLSHSILLITKQKEDSAYSSLDIYRIGFSGILLI